MNEDYAWGPEACTRCGGPLPRGLVLLERTAHIDCEEAKRSWQELQARRSG